MANLKLLWNNYVDTMSLSATRAFETTLPLQNLTRQGRSSLAQTVDQIETQITGDFDALGTKPVGGFCWYNHNMSEDGYLRLELFDGTGQTGNTVYDSGTIGPDGVAKLPGEVSSDWLDEVYLEWPVYWTNLWFPEVLAASFRLTIGDSSSDGYMNASRLILGPVFSPSINADYGVALGWDENTEQQVTDGGSLRSNTTIPARVLSFDLSNLEEAERAEVLALRRRAGKRRDMFVSVFPGAGGDLERDYTMLCKFTSMDMIGAPYHGYYSNKFQLRET